MKEKCVFPKLEKRLTCLTVRVLIFEMKTFFVIIAIVTAFILGAFFHRFETKTVALSLQHEEVALVIRTDSLTGRVSYSYIGDASSPSATTELIWSSAWQPIEMPISNASKTNSP
jgi:hypothetical protein